MPFNKLTEQFTKNPSKLNTRQIVATAHDHTEIIANSNITRAQILGLTTTMYTKPSKTVRGGGTVIKHLADARLSTPGDLDEEPITSKNV